MKIKALLLGTIVTMATLFSSSAFAEEINGYTFSDGGNAGLKVEEMSKGNVKQFLVSVALKVKEGQTINQIEGTLQLDPKVFDLEDLSKNLETSFVKGDIFTNSQDIDPNQLKQGLLTYKGTSDTGFNNVNPAEAFGVLIKAKADNQSAISNIKISSDSFRLVDTKKDPTVNLFTGEVVKEVKNIPLGTVTAPVVDTAPAVVEVDTAPAVVEVEPKVETPVVEEDTSKVVTGPKENVVFILFSLFLLAGFIYLRRTEKA